MNHNVRTLQAIQGLRRFSKLFFTGANYTVEGGIEMEY